MRNAADLLNAIISKRGYSSYLEIGVAAGDTLALVQCALKHGVDPDPTAPATFHCTSNEFFAQKLGAAGYDLVFVDGLHLWEQALLDVNNSLGLLREGGMIVMHDVLPKTDVEQARKTVQFFEGGWFFMAVEWTGDPWKALAILRATRTDLSIFTVGMDHGFGVVRRGFQVPWSPGEEDMLTYAYYEKNRDLMLAVVPVDKAMAML
jgi:hypothetical protein